MKNYESALILGLGSSGAAAAELLLRESSAVTIIDSEYSDELVSKAEGLRKKGAKIILGCNKIPEKRFDVCIISPGVPADSSWVKDAESKGIEVLSELELGASRCKCSMLAISGTNGKSTMAKLCENAMSYAGCHAALAGNYGLPLCEIVKKRKKIDWLIVEVSSFQLERVSNFKPDVGVLLNIQPDHLNRHGSMEVYTEIKSRLFAKMKKNDVRLVLDKDKETICGILKAQRRKGAKAQKGKPWITFGLSEKADYRYVNGLIHGNNTVSVKGTIFANRIMGVIAAAAVASIHACGLAPSSLEQAVRAFNPLPHRMKEVAKLNNIRFIDDSKATNLAALSAGLEMSIGAVNLIAGGFLKEKNLELIKKILAKKVKKVYLIGGAAKEMEAAWKDVVPCCQSGHLEKAVHMAWHDAQKGETILLSPGCASFGQFKNFEDRGNQFIGIVKGLNK